MNFIPPYAPCLIICEVAQNHDGSLGTAHAFIDAVADAGADAIKFQTHMAEYESTPEEPWRVKFSCQDKSRYDYWRRMEFTETQWHGLKKHAVERNLYFLSSAFSIEAVELLTRVGVGAWKVASGEVSNTIMFESMMSTGLPMMLSTGMSPMAEIDKAVQLIKASELELVLLQCTSAYPCPPEKVGLNMIPLFKEKYKCAVGLSDHTGTIYSGLAAATMGIQILEVHVTLSRKMFGPDIPVSVTMSELRQLIEGIRFIEKMTKNPVNKNLMARETESLRELFSKSIVARKDVAKGSILDASSVTVKKPGTGIPADQLQKVLGRRLLVDVEKDTMLKEDDFE